MFCLRSGCGFACTMRLEPRSFKVRTATTPGKPAAAAVSMPRMRACASLERTKATSSIPGSAMSSTKRPRPRRIAGSSMRLTDEPMFLEPMSALPTQAPRRAQRRVDDGGIAGAAAEVAGNRIAHLLFGRVGRLAQESGQRGQHARRAEPALQAVLFPERLLQRAESAVRCGEPLRRNHITGVGLHREHDAGAHRLAVEQHGACAAHAVLAAQMRSREPQLAAQEVGEVQARFHLARMPLAVHGERDGPFVYHFPMALRYAVFSARSVSTPASR